MEKLEMKARPSLSRIYRNSASDLNNFDDFATRETSPPPRPRSFHLEKTDSNVSLGKSRNMASISRQVSKNIGSNEDDDVEIFGYRNLFKESGQDILAPVVISPVTISRCIGLLLHEHVIVETIYSSQEMKDSAPEVDELEDADKSMLNTFQRAHMREIINDGPIDQVCSSVLPVYNPVCNSLSAATTDCKSADGLLHENMRRLADGI
jgi:hypothetical protein